MMNDSEPKRFNLGNLYSHLGSALLLWFVSVSLGMILAVCFQTDLYDARGVPVVLNNLWKISIYALPIYALGFFLTQCRARAVCLGSIAVVLVALMSDLTSLPSNDHFTFIDSNNEVTVEVVDEVSSEDETELISEESIMDLPDEL